jgi:sugar lactone lactonase YvrE
MRYLKYVVAMALMIAPAFAQDSNAPGIGPDSTVPTNDAPNPYKSIKDFFKLPEGRPWGSTSSVEIDKDGKSIWVAERCGANSCFDPKTGQWNNVPSVMKFDSTGKMVKAFGGGMLVAPHGIYVDRDGNVWVTDYQDNGPVPPRGTPRPTPIGPMPGATKGNQVWKFSPDGKVLLVLGKAGGAAAPDYFYNPNDVVTAPNGDIFVSEGHGVGNNRVLKFDRRGKFIKEWGKLGTGPGEFDQPHALAIDSHNRLLVGDRNNNRVQIFDLNGKFLGQLHQFSRPSGIWVTKDDVLFVADSESESVSRNHNGWKRGIRWGSLKDGKVVGFIPDPVADAKGTSAAEGVAVDPNGNIYGAEVGPKDVMKYVSQ